jgi:hypothetical protein
MSGKTMVQRLKTDHLGIYDFGEIPPGKYRIHLYAFAFCAPEVICKANGCGFRPKLKLKPKSQTPVH